ncbi:MAG TPA: hypothetical protein VGJ06_02630 [Candidatus Acidoferrum sp.]|jgi:hypothetical protein
MKRNLILLGFVLLGLTLTAPAGNKTLTADPLTGLPIVPSPDPLHLGNEPMVLPVTKICKSNAQMNFYSMNGIRVNATVAWYAGQLHGFKKTHAWASERSQDTFYKPDGTMIVSITGDPAASGADADVHGIVYGKFEPAIAEKTIIGMNSQNIVCP